MDDKKTDAVDTTSSIHASGTAGQQPSASAAKSEQQTGRINADALFPLGIGLAAFAVYLLSWDKSGQFDSVISAGIAERWNPSIALKILLPSNHFLFNLAGWCLYPLTSIIFKWDGYQTLQLLNSLAGAACLSALAWAALENGASKRWTALLCALIGAGNIYWSKSAGAEAYITGTLFAALTVLAAWRYAEKNTARRAVIAGILAVLTVLFHTGNALIIPAVLIFIWLVSERTTRNRHTLYAAAAVMLLSIPYAVTHKIYSPSGAKLWWARGSGAVKVYSSGPVESSWHMPFLSNFSGTAMSPFNSAVQDAGIGDVFTILAILFCLALALAREKREAATHASTAAFRLAAALFIGETLFYSFWQPGNFHYWCLHWTLGGLVLIFADVPKKLKEQVSPRSATLCLCGAMAGILTVGTLTLANVILPRRDARAYPLVLITKDWNRFLPQDALILTSGLQWGELKPYIPYYSDRNRVVIELEAMEFPPLTVAGRIEGILASAVGNEIPVYATSDVWDGKVRKEFEDKWGIKSEWLDIILSRFKQVPVMAALIPERGTLTLYRLIPVEKPVYRKPGQPLNR